MKIRYDENENKCYLEEENDLSVVMYGDDMELVPFDGAVQVVVDTVDEILDLIESMNPEDFKGQDAVSAVNSFKLDVMGAIHNKYFGGLSDAGLEDDRAISSDDITTDIR